jgi:hypothetical protein
VDDSPDAGKGHDTKANPNEDAHACNSTNDVANECSKIDVIRDLSSVHCYSLFLVSMHIVTGPSFSISTFMSAPNSPVPTGFPMASERSLQNAS